MIKILLKCNIAFVPFDIGDGVAPFLSETITVFHSVDVFDVFDQVDVVIVFGRFGVGLIEFAIKCVNLIEFFGIEFGESIAIRFDDAHEILFDGIEELVGII